MKSTAAKRVSPKAGDDDSADDDDEDVAVASDSFEVFVAEGLPETIIGYCGLSLCTSEATIVAYKARRVRVSMNG